MRGMTVCLDGVMTKMQSFCPECGKELVHFDMGKYNVFGCDVCRKEITYAEEITLSTRTNDKGEIVEQKIIVEGKDKNE